MVVIQQEEVLRRPPAPYIPWSTFRAFFDNVSPLPNRIDRSVLRYTSGTNQTLLFHAFKALGLTSPDGAVTPAMRTLAESFVAGDKQPLKQLLRAAYPTLFEPPFDLTRATPNELREQFEGMGLQGNTARKGQGFFLAAAEAAGIEFSHHLKARAPNAPRRSGGTKAPKRSPRAEQPGGAAGDGYAPSTRLSGLNLPGPVLGILELLPTIAPEWNQQTHDRFLNTFVGALDLCYPVSDRK
jgi:hypothetical protein